jgi:transposase-like protein
MSLKREANSAKIRDLRDVAGPLDRSQPVDTLKVKAPQMPSSKSTQPIPPCPRCSSKFTIKKGRRQNRFRILQVFQCRECLYKFTAAAGKNKTYPPT